MDGAALKKELDTITSQLTALRVKERVMQEELDALQLKAAQIEGAGMYVRGKLLEAGEDIGSNGGGTLPDLTKI